MLKLITIRLFLWKINAMQLPTINRKYLPTDQVLNTFNDVQPSYDELLSREINTKVAFVQWLMDLGEMDAFLEENGAWRYIKMSINTADSALTDSYTFFVTEIQPKLAPLNNALNEKMMQSEFVDELAEDPAYAIFFRSVKVQLDLFREENISIEAYLAEKSQEFGSISAAQTIDYLGEILTMQQASVHLKNQDEKLRKEIYEKMAARKRSDIAALNDLYSDLIAQRHQLALNAGFDNYRDYTFQSMGRFDYTKEACFDFHEAVAQKVVPLVKKIQLKKLHKLGKNTFKPWDLDVDPDGHAPLKPFRNGQEMLDKTIGIFDKMDPFFGDCLRTMHTLGHLDLESKAGKAPGGYNYPLYEIGVPFIFMNAVGLHRDLITMVHEGGHAIHSFLNRELELTSFKNIPSEAAELASMSMELLSMKYWEAFYSDETELKRAKIEHMEDLLKVLPWIAQIDAFQHWVYTHPTHSLEARSEQWLALGRKFGTGLTDWTGYEDLQASGWQRQLHLFEVPFYYIEYGIAQLGAIGVWKNSLFNETDALEKYKTGLALGYTRSLPEIYEAAGVPFDFSPKRMGELMDFVDSYLKTLG
jgi:oligoendopeptidase F